MQVEFPSNSTEKLERYRTTYGIHKGLAESAILLFLFISKHKFKVM